VPGLEYWSHGGVFLREDGVGCPEFVRFRDVNFVQRAWMAVDCLGYKVICVWAIFLIVGEFFHMRDIITLACEDCKNRNYSTTKNKRKTPDKLAFKKYCPFCRTHTLHKETK